jgi:hypothetical protein
VLRNEGRGTFFERAFDHLLVTPLALAVADLDGNGRKDVVLAGMMLDANGQPVLDASGNSVGAVEPLFSACAP